MGAVLKAIASMALVAIAVVCGLLAWGASEHLPDRWLILVASLLVLVSCLWGTWKLWKTPTTSTATLDSNAEANFELWLAKKIVESTELSDDQVAALRAEYVKEFGNR